MYLTNFKGCSECGGLNRAMDALKQVDKTESEDTDDDDDVTKEVVQFKRNLSDPSCLTFISRQHPSRI